MPSDGTWPAELIENANHARKAAPIAGHQRQPSLGALYHRGWGPGTREGTHSGCLPEIRFEMLERETGLEPATSCLGSPDLVSAVARA